MKGEQTELEGWCIMDKQTAGNENRYGLEKGALGNAIRQARINSGLSQERLAELAGITPTHLKHIESEHRKPSVEVLFRLVDVLHFSVDRLFMPAADEREELLHMAELLLARCSEKQLHVTIALLEAMLKNQE